MAADLPFPETLDALSAQLVACIEGRKPAVLVPHFQPDWRPPAGLALEATPMGSVLYRPGTVAPERIHAAVREQTMGALLGYGIDHKPEAADRAMVLARAGAEIVAVACDAETAPAVAAALRRMAGPTDTVEEWTPRDVALGRVRWWHLQLLDQTPTPHTP